MLPTLMIVFALLAQPVCLLYTRMVMGHAAAQAARVAAVGSAEDVRAFVLRRLRAVPEASPFHVGGSDDWEVSTIRTDEGDICVRVVGHARPLPLLGAVAAFAGMSDERGVVLVAEVRERVRPDWLEGDYASWAT